MRNDASSLPAVAQDQGLMRFLVAPQAFKGSLSSSGVAAAIVTGLRRVFADAEFTLLPLADGGEGTVHALVEATGGKLYSATVSGPLGDRLEANWGLLGDGCTAVIEMAAASGLPLVPPNRLNPLLASTYGTGELIRSALDAGCRDFIIGIGGSATNDAGAGMAQALGVRLLNDAGEDLPRGGAALSRLARIDAVGLDPRARESRFLVACDVNNPLCGRDGASAVYGPQKGATPEMVALLDGALRRFAEIVARDLGKQIADQPGAGAAGGLGAGLIAFLGASLRSGIEIVLEATRFAERCVGADVVFTGEGRLDGQTVQGKTVAGVARAAKQLGRPVVAIGGWIAPDGYILLQHGVDAMLGIAPGPMTMEQLVVDADKLIADAAEQSGRLLRIGEKIGDRLPRCP